MNDRLTVCVIIPTYNRAELLRQALDSLLRQTRPVDEIIVIDDGSTDATVNMLAHFAAPITLLTQVHLGRSQARNRGLQTARADLIAFLDDDDTLAEDSIEQRAEFLEAHPATDVVYSDTLALDMDGAVLGDYTRANPVKPSGSVFAEMVRQNLAAIHAYMFRRGCLATSGLFDVGLDSAEDWDFWIRMAAHRTFAHLNAPLALYRFHPEMSSLNVQAKLAANGLSVQRRAFEMPTFQTLTPLQQARLYLHYARWSLRINALAEARTYARKALQAAQGASKVAVSAYSLLALVTVLQRIAPTILQRDWVWNLLRGQRRGRRPY